VYLAFHDLSMQDLLRSDVISRGLITVPDFMFVRINAFPEFIWDMSLSDL
jgi:hypothetical protein